MCIIYLYEDLKGQKVAIYLYISIYSDARLTEWRQVQEAAKISK